MRFGSFSGTPWSLRKLAAALLGLLSLAGCEGVLTGQQVSVQALSQNEDGSFASVRLSLTPEMNPVAINFKGMTIAHPDESARWNSYAAQLTRGGTTIASSRFDINNPGTRDHDHGGPFVRTLFFATIPEAGDYELVIAPTKPKEITIQEASIEVRRNTQPPPK